MKNKNLLRLGLFVSVMVVLILSFMILNDRSSPEPQALTGKTTISAPDTAEVKPSDSLENESEVAPSAKVQAGAPDVKGVQVFGTVSMADTGEPVADVAVLLMRGGNWGGYEPEIAVTDDQGRFEMIYQNRGRAILYARKDALISFRDKQNVTSVSIKAEDTSVGPVHLKLFPAKLLKIKVMSELSGNPLPGAKARTLANPRVTFEDEQNGFLNVPLSRDFWSFQVMAPGHEMKRLNVDLNKGFRETIEVALQPAGRLFGYITNENGEAVEDAWIFSEYSGLQTVAKSDASGYYELENLPLRKKLYLRARKKHIGQAFKEFTIDDGGEAEISLVLAPSQVNSQEPTKDVSIEGYVVDTKDQPLENAVVNFSQGYRNENFSEVKTNAEGFFRMDILVNHSYLNALHISKPGFAFQYMKIEPSVAAPIKVKVVLEQGHFLRGTVNSASGDPIADASLTLQIPNQRGYSSRYEQVKTDVSGFFQFEDLPEKINLHIRAEGFSRKEIKAPELDRDDAVFVLDGLGRIHGSVVYKETGKPVQAYKIFIAEKDPGRSGVFSAKRSKYPGGLWIQAGDGAFEFEGLEVGQNYQISVEADRFGLKQPLEVTVVPLGEESSLLLELDPFEDRYEGVVLDSDSRPLAGVELTLLGSPNNLMGRHRSSFNFNGQQLGITFRDAQVSDTQGRFVFDGIPSNIHLFLDAKTKGYAPGYFDNLEGMKPSERQNLVFNLYRAGKLLVVLEKDPLPDKVYLNVSGRGGQNHHVEITESGLENEIADLLPGTFDIRAFSASNPLNDDSHFSLQKTVELEEGETLRVVLSEGDKKTLSGVAMVEGVPAAKRRLSLKPQQEIGNEAGFTFNIRFVTTDETGRFQIKGIESGSYKLMLVSRQQVLRDDFMSPGMIDSPNAVMVTIAGKDVDDVFSFRRFSRVTGRLMNAEGISNVLLSKHPFMATNSFQSPVGLDNTFQFVDIEPGIFSLHVVEGQAPNFRLVRSEIVIPENGSDVDLGDIDSEPVGKLRLILQSEWLPPGERQLVFVIFGEKDVLNQNSLATLFKHTWDDLSEPLEIDGLAEGKYALALINYSGGFVTEPKSPIFDIRSNNTTDMVLSLKPTTHLVGLVPGKSRIVSAELTHEESSQVVVFEILPLADTISTFLLRETYAIAWKNSIIASGLATGSWYLKVGFDDGKTSQQKIILKEGESLYLDLVPNQKSNP